MWVGIIRSTSSISFENRLIILPRGVVSKKLIVDIKMCSKSSLCNYISNKFIAFYWLKAESREKQNLNRRSECPSCDHNNCNKYCKGLQNAQGSINCKIFIPDCGIDASGLVLGPNWEPKVASNIASLQTGHKLGSCLGKVFDGVAVADCHGIRLGIWGYGVWTLAAPGNLWLRVAKKIANDSQPQNSVPNE